MKRTNIFNSLYILWMGFLVGYSIHNMTTKEFIFSIIITMIGFIFLQLQYTIFEEVDDKR